MIREHKKRAVREGGSKSFTLRQENWGFLFNKYKKADYFPCAVNRMVLWDRKSLNNVVRFEPKSCVYK